MLKNKNRLTALVILFTFAINLIEMPLVNVAKAAPLVLPKSITDIATVIEKVLKPAPQNHWGIVAILVEKSLMEESVNYSAAYPIHTDKLKTSTLAERIRRYAMDVQNTQAYTKSNIIKAEKTAGAPQIAAMLEKLYQEGDGVNGEINKLAGVVIIGDVPLPVVNKNGNRFLSMLPYTDFDDKVYVYDPKNGDFVLNPALQFAKAEVWHGVIKPPRGGTEGKQLLAQYFDKNHLYHLGIKEFSDFSTEKKTHPYDSSKIFMMDLFNEFKGMNKTAFPSYLGYLAHIGDFAYQRFTKKLAQKFLKQQNKQLQDEGLADDQLHPNQPCDKTCVILKNSRALDFDSDGYPNGYELFKGNLLPGFKEIAGKQFDIDKPTNPKNPFSFPLDLSKGLVILPRTSPSRFDPRYSVDDGSKLDYPDPDPSASSSTGLSTMPDIQSKLLVMNFAKRYVELFDKFIANMNDWVGFTGRYESNYKDSAGKNRSDIHNMPALISMNDEYTSRYLKLLNDAIEKKIDEFANKLQSNILLLAGAKISGSLVSSSDGIAKVLPVIEFVNFASEKTGAFSATQYINGKQVTGSDSLKSALDCTLYRGSDDNTGKNTQTVLSMRTFSPLATEDGRDAGCNSSNALHPEYCFLHASTIPVYDPNGTKAIDDNILPESATSHRACYDFKEKSRFLEYKKEVADYLKKVAEKKKVEEEIIKIPLPGSPYLAADKIMLFNGFGIKISLADILVKLSIGKDDWLAIGENFLKKTRTFNFGEKSFTGVNKLELTVESIPALDSKTGAPIFVPSIIFHKEPTKETIESQTKTGIATSLPVDNPRHVTFQDKVGNFRKIVYPNAFTEKSYVDFVDNLKRIEKELKEVGRLNGLNVDNPSAADYVPIEGSLSVIPKAASGDSINELKTIDTFTWRDANIDDKHQYVIEKYLGSAEKPLTAKEKNGYEMLYLVAKGPADALQLSFESDYEQQVATAKSLEKTGDVLSTPKVVEKSTSDGKKDDKEDGVFIIEWFEEIKKWLKETTTKLSGTYPSEPACKLSDKTEVEAKGKLDIFGGSGAGAGKGSTESSEVFGTSKGTITKETVAETGFKPMPTTDEKATLLATDKKLLLKTQQTTLFSSQSATAQKADSASASAKKEEKVSKSIFKDIDEQREGYKEITKLLQLGVIKGYSDGTFKPDQAITREEFTKVDLGAICIQCVNFQENLKRVIQNIYQKQPFPDKDIAPELLYCVMEAKNRNIVGGYQGGPQKGFFVPKTTISRAEATRVLLETARQLSPITFSSYSLENKPWYYNYVLTAQQLNLYPAGRFKQLDKSDPKAFKVWFDFEINKGNNPIKTWLERSMSRLEFAIMAAKLIEKFDCFGKKQTKAGLSQEIRSEVATGKPGSLKTKTGDAKETVKFDFTQTAARETGTPGETDDGIKPGMATVPSKTGSSTSKDESKPADLSSAVKDKSTGLSVSGPAKTIVTALSTSTKIGETPSLDVSKSGIGLSTIAEAVAKVAKKTASIKTIKAEKFKDISPRVLFVSLLGSAFGNVLQENYLGGWMTFSGTTQSAISLLSEPKPPLKLFEVESNGKVTVFDADNIQMRSRPGKDVGTKIATLSDTVTREDLAEIDGANMRVLTDKPNFRIVKMFSGNSSNGAQGLAFVDTKRELPTSQMPGLNYVSLEKSPEEEGIGFHGNTKHMLLFAAGNSVGEASLPYASEIGVVLGDPTVRLGSKVNVSKTGFTKDIGSEINFGESVIKELIAFDYNSDGLKDVLINYGDGKIRLLQNNKGYPRFIDKGIFIDIPGGIMSMAAADFNKDGQEDLIVASKTSCRAGEICLNIYENNKGNLARKYLPLQPFTSKNRIYTIKTADVNNDSYPDLITSDDTGSIRIFYNKKEKIEEQGQLLGFLGLHIDQNANLKSEIVVAYDGMPKKDEGRPETAQNYIDLNLGESKIELPFLYLDLDPNLETSIKRAADLTPPLNSIAIGDQIQYSITFKNNGPKDIKNFMFSDVNPSNIEVKTASFACIDCAGEKLQITTTGNDTYPNAISGLTIPKGKSRTINYIGAVKETPKIKIITGKKLSSLYSALPGYLEIGATPEGNASSRMTYFYPTSKDPISSRMTYNTFVSAPPTAPKPPKTITNPLGDIPADKKSYSDATNEGRASAIGKIKDYFSDRLKESFGDKIDDSLENIDDSIQKLLTELTCSGGCIPMPVNFSFLTPGTINVMGVPGGFDPGIPVFGWGVPSIIPVWPPSPYQGSLGGRIYISPTLTGSLGMGICLGPYLVSQCYAFKLIDLLPKGACAALQKTMEEAMAKANNAIKSTGYTAMVESGQTADSSGRSATGGMAGSTTLGTYQYKATASTNFRIPGFPQVITKWLEDQIFEITNKLLDLPDFYFIYPDPTSIVGSFIPQEGARQGAESGQKKAYELPTFSTKPFQYSEKGYKAVLSTPGKILSFFNSVPLIQVQAKEIAIKIPALTAVEIEKIRRDWEQWKLDLKEEVKRAKEIWSCDKKSVYQTYCDKLTLDSAALISSLEKNLAILEKYKTLPRRILAWKNAIGKYLYQVICYMDAIMNYFGGYIKKQQIRVNTWIDAIRKAEEMVRTWKVILDVMVDYQSSCDKCSSSRFSLMELLLRVFAIIPSPPVVPFPKWPDVYFDFSKVQLGLKIPFPDVRFIPEQIIIPKLPRITFPDLPVATVDIALPQIPILPAPPELDLSKLPDLPPLPLPTLPDIPPPPKIPKLPNQIKTAMLSIKKLIKILCMLRKGLIPVPELSLKTQIEHLTERGLTPLLPFDIGTKLHIPPIKYNSVDRIEVLGTANFKLELGNIYEFVEKIADEWNAIATDLIKQTNKSIKEGSKILEGTVKAPEKALKKVVPSEDIKIDLEKPTSYVNPPNIHLVATQRFLDKNDPLLNRKPEELKSVILKQVQDENLPQSGSLRNLANTRNALLAYLDGQNRPFKVNDTINNSVEFKRYLAATEIPQSKINEAQIKSINMKLNDEGLTSVSNDLRRSASSIAKFYAAEKGVTDVGTGAAPNAPQKGIFILNSELGINERLINYTDETDQPSQLLFIDMDNDGDEEIIYSYGSNIYLKENYAKAGSQIYYNRDPQVYDLKDYMVLMASVGDFQAVANNNKSVELSWNTVDDNNIAGYEIRYGATPESVEQNIGIQTHFVKAKNTDTATFTLPNGFYYGKIRAVSNAGILSTASNTILFAPSVCNDKDAPLPNGGPATRNVPIFKTLTIDASKSFDGSSEIVQYFIDTNLIVDSDKDGDSTNDKDMASSNGIFKLGPYDDLNDRKIALNVFDEAFNSSRQYITIHVTVPQIVLDPQSLRDGIMQGAVNPPESEIPIAIIRNRAGNITALRTKSADAKGKYRTDNNGKFTVNDLNLKDPKDPFLDSDNDGIPDQWELIYGLNPDDPGDAQKDNDQDGLTNLEEYRAGTNPLKSDTNNDGISDSEELRYGRAAGQKISLPYRDVYATNPYYQDIFRLWIRRVFEELPGWEKTLFEPNKALNRAEFANIMLNTFCIIPRREAYEAPSPFKDMEYQRDRLPWYYAFVKEAYFQGFVTGYKREVDVKSGKTPFKAEAAITRAEAIKVILEALEKHGVVVIGKVPITTPYYLPYIKIAQNLTPYLKKPGRIRNPFILTKEEALRPNEAVSRGTFIAMANRVLTAYDCSMFDSDKDGMPDYWELQNGLNPNNASDANLDPDKDDLMNLEEYRHGSDPHDPDTDVGGIKDGNEVKKGTNPLDKKDDSYYLEAQKLGLQHVQAQCTSCPCPVTLEQTFDLVKGDIVFAVIGNDDNSQIFSKSNEISVPESVKKIRRSDN